MNNLYDKILGSLVAAGMGDGLGAPTEGMSYDEICKMFGGPVQWFMDPKDHAVSFANRPGEVTDDTSQLWEMAQAVIRAGGKLTLKDAADGLLAWSKNWPRYYPQQAGPTMRNWVKLYEDGADLVQLGQYGNHYNRGMTNGCIMRVSPAALVFPGKLDDAIDNAITMTRVSHATQHALSSAGCIAAVISEALTETSSVHSVIKAAMYGAEKGRAAAFDFGRDAYGPLLRNQLLRALQCVYGADNAASAARALDQEVGCGLDAASTCASAIGLFVANDGEVIPSLLAAANYGGDTDTLACVVGMIAGAYKGSMSST